jgi:long-subunit fatty acid transport protein
MKTVSAVLFISLGIVLTQTASAQYAEDALRFSQYGLGVGARSLGMGDAAVGLVNDYTSLFWNPAGLALERNYEFSIGLSNNALGNDASFFGSTVNATKNATNLNNLGFVYPIATSRGSLTFGFGFGRVSNFNNTVSFSGFNPQSSIVESMAPVTNLNGLSTDAVSSLLDNNLAYQVYLADTANSGGFLYPIVTDSVGQSATVLEGGGLNHWSFGGAVEVAKDLMVGVSLNFVSGTYTYDRVYTEQDSKGIYLNFPFDFNKFVYESTISSDLSGFNALFGLMLKKQGRYQIGIAVRTPTQFEINETFTDDGKSYFKNGDSYHQSYSNQTKYRITSPLVLSGGISLQATDWLVLAGDAEYTDWTQMEFNTDNPDLIAENHFIATGMRPTTNLRGGAEVTFWNLGLKLRGGIVWNPSPYKGDPSSFDQLYYTAGVGYDLDNNVTLNAAYALGTWKTFRDNYFIASIPNASTTSENVKSNNVNVSLSYRF